MSALRLDARQSILENTIITHQSRPPPPSSSSDDTERTQVVAKLTGADKNTPFYINTKAHFNTMVTRFRGPCFFWPSLDTLPPALAQGHYVTLCPLWLGSSAENIAPRPVFRRLAVCRSHLTIRNGCPFTNFRTWRCSLCQDAAGRFPSWTDARLRCCCEDVHIIPQHRLIGLAVLACRKTFHLARPNSPLGTSNGAPLTNLAELVPALAVRSMFQDTSL